MHFQNNQNQVKDNYFSNILRVHLAEYNNIMSQDNLDERLKSLTKDVEFFIKKFKDENDLIITHEGKVVTKVLFEVDRGALRITIL